LAARECHRSDGSPSLKLASAQRGWGLPRPQADQETDYKMKQISIPRSSRTRLSNSAILLRKRVVSSREGSSLEHHSFRTSHRAEVRHGRTSMLGHQSRIHIGQSMDMMRRADKGASEGRTRPSWMQRWQGRFLSHCGGVRKRRGGCREDEPCVWRCDS